MRHFFSGILKKMFTSGCKETTNSELVLTVNSETCKMFLHFCYFGTFSRSFLDSLTNEIFVIAMELGFLAHSYQVMNGGGSNFLIWLEVFRCTIC